MQIVSETRTPGVGERTRRLPRSQRDRRKISYLTDENSRLAAENCELRAELVELNEAIALRRSPGFDDRRR